MTGFKAQAARRKGAVWSACAIALAITLGLTSSSLSKDGFSGSYTVVDGPAAGTGIHADADGTVAISHRTNAHAHAKGKIGKDKQGCAGVGFRGKIDGHHSPDGGCWEVIPIEHIGELLFEISVALFAEDEALRGNPHLHIEVSIETLAKASDLLDAAITSGEVSDDQAEGLKDRIAKAHRLDEKADKNFKDGHRDKARDQLEDAIRAKRQFVKDMPSTLYWAKPPVIKPIHAEFDSSKSQTVYSEVATDPQGRNLQFTWALAEHNDPTCINFEPNKPTVDKAIWHHGDTQGCSHTLEGSQGHNGTVSVVVSNNSFACAAFFNGSQGPSGQPVGDGPDPEPCVEINR